MTPPVHGAHRRRDSAWDVAVWAPLAGEVRVQIRDAEVAALHDGGWWRAVIDGDHGDHYRIVLDGERVRPDPASRWQPEGVHGPSALVDPGQYTWTDDDWTGISSLEGHVLYELHVGTFSDEGTFDGVIPHLDALVALGITVIELLPIAQFPGGCNWGYDGVLVSAAQDTYGGPDGLARLVDAAHARGLGVVLDVVYNHFGPEGNHLGDFGPYFTDTFSTPWGDALNFGEPGSDNVRSLFIDSARQWIADHHVDGFRLDAVHAILDTTAWPFLEQLTAAVHEEATRLGRAAVVVAESSDNDPRLIRGPERGGFGMDGVWHDEVHHAVRVALTGEAPGYYADHADGAAGLAAAFDRNVVHDGRFSIVRGRTHGRPAADVPGHRYVVCDQNHDQVGNRLAGERLDVLVDSERRRAAAGVVALGPFTPMLWMGEEYGETRPFPYFVSHTDADLLEAVRRGRRAEFAAFDWDREPPDPGSAETFRSAVLDRSTDDGNLRRLWTDLLSARKAHPSVWSARARRDVTSIDDTVVLVRSLPAGPGPDDRPERTALVVHLADGDMPVELPRGDWTMVVTTSAHLGDATPEGGVVVAPAWSVTLLAEG